MASISNGDLDSPSPFRLSFSPGVGKQWGMPPLGVKEPFGGDNEGLEKTSIFFRTHCSPVGTDIVTVSLGKITAQPGRVWQETAGTCSGSLCFVCWLSTAVCRGQAARVSLPGPLPPLRFHPILNTRAMRKWVPFHFLLLTSRNRLLRDDRSQNQGEESAQSWWRFTMRLYNYNYNTKPRIQRLAQAKHTQLARINELAHVNFHVADHTFEM